MAIGRECILPLPSLRFSMWGPLIKLIIDRLAGEQDLVHVGELRRKGGKTQRGSQTQRLKYHLTTYTGGCLCLQWDRRTGRLWEDE